MALVGQQLGAYRLLKLIRSNNKSEVYQAETSGRPRQALVTVIPLDAAFHPDPRAVKDAIGAFRQEAARVMSLSHPALNPLLFYGEETRGQMSYLYLATAATVDGTLDDYLQRRNSLLELEDSNRVIQQVAAALGYLHTRHFIHGSVKPSSIVIKSSDNHHIYQVCVDDLAVVRCIAAVYSTSAIRGNPSYLAPEQWSARTTIDSDQYALGVLAYKLMTGHTPFHGTLEQLNQQHLYATMRPASTLNGKLPREVDAVLARATAKDPGKRYHSVGAFAQALDQALQPGKAGKQKLMSRLSLSWNKPTNARELTVFKASLLLFLVFTGIFVIIACIFLNSYHLLPAPIAIFGSAFSALITFATTVWGLFEKLITKSVLRMWLKARRLPVVLISLATCVIILCALIYIYARIHA